METPTAPLYWLSRNGGQPEGPFDVPEIQRAWKAKRIREGDKLLLDGTKEWKPAESVAGEVKTPAVPVNDAQKWQEMLDARDRKTSDNCGNAVSALAFFVLLASCVPLIGIPVALLIYGTFALIGTVLAVVQMVKGYSSEGIISLVVVYVAVPLLGVVAQIAVIKLIGVLNE